MTTCTALTILAQNGYTTTDFSAEVVEYIMDDCVDTINSEAQQTIAYMTGTAGSKTLTLTGNQNAAFKPLITMKLRESKKTSLTNSSSTSGSSSSNKSTSLGPVSFSTGASVGNSISAAAAINTAANTIELGLYQSAIKNLLLASALPPIVVGYDPVT